MLVRSSSCHSHLVEFVHNSCLVSYADFKTEEWDGEDLDKPSKELHLEGEGKYETKDDDGIYGDLKSINGSDSVQASQALLEDNTSVSDL